MSLKKVVDAFKGLIYSLELEPLHGKTKLKEEYVCDQSSTFTMGESTELHFLCYKGKYFERVIGLICDHFPNQVDERSASRLLGKALRNWICSGEDLKDQHVIEKVGKEYVSEVEKHIRLRRVFIPLEGLKFRINQGVEIGNCWLASNEARPELLQALQNQREYFEDISASSNASIDLAECYFSIDLEAELRKAHSRGREEAKLSLSILRLYFSSYFNQGHSRRDKVTFKIGIAGTLFFEEQTRIYSILPDKPIENQCPSFHESRVPYRDRKLNRDWLDYMEKSGLSRINELVSTDNHTTLSRRMKIAITWFDKGTQANNMADSFLMYAVAIEGLLSEGRTSKETYARRIAYLLKDVLDQLPKNSLSQSFRNKLNTQDSTDDRSGLIEERVVELFKLRNQVAHGGKLNDEMVADQLRDFQTFVRQSIISFVSNYSKFL